MKWLQAERLREIAYGLHTGRGGYDIIFSKLSETDQAAVNRIRAGIGKGR